MKIKALLKKYIGSKEFYSNVFKIIIPIMLQQLFLSVAGYIDSLMINSYGAGGLAYNGVSAANKIIFVCNFIALGFTAAIGIFIAQYFGARDRYKIKEAFRLTIYSMVIVGVVMFFIIKFLGYSVVDQYIQDPVARQFGYDYVDVICFGQIFVCLNMGYANAYRTIQKPVIPLVVGGIGIVINCFFNYCMIFGHFGFNEMGASGAALATVISKIVELICYIISIPLLKIDMFQHSFKKIFVSGTLLKKFFIRGTPIILNEVFWSFSMVLLTKFYTYNNDLWYQAYAYTQNITDLFFIVFAGLGNGTAILLGSSLGEGDFDKALQDSYYFKGLAIMMGLIVGVLMASTSRLTSLMFTRDPEVLNLMSGILIVTSVFTAIYCYNSVCFFTLRAGGDSYRAIAVDQLPTYFVGLPIAIIFGTHAAKWGINVVVVYLVTHTLDLTKIFLATYFVNKKHWIKNLTKKDEF